MNLTSPTQVKGWCIAHGFHPNRTLGQNFLIDRNVLEAIVDASGATPQTNLLEVGPGLGVLTEALLDCGARVTAVEKDSRLCAWLRESLGDRAPLTLIEGDMLACNLDTLLVPRFDAFVSNLPYSVGTRILIDVALHRAAPPLLTVLVQSEVADRFAAPPGGAQRGLAGVWLQRLYEVERLRTIKASCFWPRPKIDSTLVRLTRHNRFPLDDNAEQRFRAWTKLAFTHRRKQLASLFRHAWRECDATTITTWLEGGGIAASARAEALSLTQWCALAQQDAPSGSRTDDVENN